VQFQNCLPEFCSIQDVFNGAGKSQKHINGISLQPTKEGADDDFVWSQGKKKNFQLKSPNRCPSNLI